MLALARGDRRALARRIVSELVELATVVAERQRDAEHDVLAEWRDLERRALDCDTRHTQVERRFEKVEADLRWINEVGLPRKRQHAARLRQQIYLLRPASITPTPNRFWRTLLYCGGLALVWILLWQLFLQLGYR